VMDQAVGGVANDKSRMRRRREYILRVGPLIAILKEGVKGETLELIINRPVNRYGSPGPTRPQTGRMAHLTERPVDCPPTRQQTYIMQHAVTQSAHYNLGTFTFFYSTRPRSVSHQIVGIEWNFRAPRLSPASDAMVSHTMEDLICLHNRL